MSRQDNTATGVPSGKTYDLMVIGAGFAGMAGALFAAQAGMSVALAGSTGGIDFSTGFIDLMGVHPIAEGRTWDNPWEAVQAVVKDCPNHPYARLERGDMETALDTFTDFLAAQGLAYKGYPDRNARMMTPAGTVKRTFRVPESMWGGVRALEEKAPTLIVDFHGLKGFSARQIVETLSGTSGAPMSGLRAERVHFPGGRGELYPEHMSWTMMEARNRAKLADTVAQIVGDAQYIGFPAVLGPMDPMSVLRDLEERLGRTVFEIPTLPPSIAGPRLRGAFDRGLPPLGVDMLSQKLVSGVSRTSDGVFEFQVGKPSSPIMVRARKALLASGRFFGKGLKGERTGVKEAVFGLPVVQPETRAEWHQRNFLDRRGHPVNTAGLEVDEMMRPLGSRDDNLYAAGAVLAHQDWMRMKCGAGLAVTTAWKAIQAMRSGRETR